MEVTAMILTMSWWKDDYDRWNTAYERKLDEARGNAEAGFFQFC